LERKLVKAFHGESLQKARFATVFPGTFTIMKMVRYIELRKIEFWKGKWLEKAVLGLINEFSGLIFDF
jgi:hypothetical protein